MERIISELLDWKLQFREYKTLLLTGSTEEDRTKVIKEFAMNYFDNMVHINLKNNQEVREYINTMPTGRDAYYFIEKAVHDMIVPLFMADPAEYEEAYGYVVSENCYIPERFRM